MSSRRFAAVILLAALSLTEAQQPSIGVPVPRLAAGPFIFDTAEQHKIKVAVVAKGLVHPWSLAFLPNLVC
jgi:glucose/arabinose dehydrogenase